MFSTSNFFIMIFYECTLQISHGLEDLYSYLATALLTAPVSY